MLHWRLFYSPDLIFPQVLLLLYYPHTLRELCHQATVSQTIGRDTARSRKLQRYDTVYRERSQFEDDDESLARQE